MERAYSILMFCFAGAILLYAALLSGGNADLLPRRVILKKQGRKAYVKRLAKVLALASLSPLSSGAVAWFVDINRYPAVAVVTLIGVFILCMWRGVRMMDEFM